MHSVLSITGSRRLEKVGGDWRRLEKTEKGRRRLEMAGEGWKMLDKILEGRRKF